MKMSIFTVWGCGRLVQENICHAETEQRCCRLREAGPAQISQGEGNIEQLEERCWWPNICGICYRHLFDEKKALNLAFRCGWQVNKMNHCNSATWMAQPWRQGGVAGDLIGAQNRAAASMNWVNGLDVCTSGQAVSQGNCFSQIQLEGQQSKEKLGNVHVLSSFSIQLSVERYSCSQSQ